MKKICWLLLIMMLLCGCSPQQTLETVNDELLLATAAPQKELTVKLPADAASSALSSDDGDQLYFCDGYTVMLQTSPSGDMNRTVSRLCGFDRTRLTVMETKLGGLRRYDWTWTSAGEGSTQVGRAAVLDDGDYHYCMTVMADEANISELDGRWDALFASMNLKR